MVKVPQHLTYNGYDYRLVELKDNVAVFEQLDGGITVGFEVFLVGTFFRFPRDEDFGKTAWAYKTLDDALNKVGRLKK